MNVFPYAIRDQSTNVCGQTRTKTGTKINVTIGTGILSSSMTSLQFTKQGELWKSLQRTMRFSKISEVSVASQNGWKIALKINFSRSRFRVVILIFFRGTAYFADWANILLMRILSWTQSVEFTHMLNIPPDFHIEYSVLNMHLWLILQKLDEFKTKESNLMIRCLN